MIPFSMASLIYSNLWMIFESGRTLKAHTVNEMLHPVDMK